MDLIYTNANGEDQGILSAYAFDLSFGASENDFEILEKIAQLHVILENWFDAIEAYKKILSLEDSASTNYLYHQNFLQTRQ